MACPFVFSSSAAVYGTPESGWSPRTPRPRPSPPYGESKLVGEWLLADQARATAETPPPLRHTSLRYFNVVGSGYPDLRDTSPHNLFPLVFDALAEGRVPHINGDRLPHPGRHLCPGLRPRLRPGHLARRRRPGAAGRAAAGAGLQPRQRDRAVGPPDHGRRRPRHRCRLRSRDTARRPGDPAQIVASGELAARDLGWKMRHTVDEMVASAWAAAASRLPPPALRARCSSVARRSDEEGRSSVPMRTTRQQSATGARRARGPHTRNTVVTLPRELERGRNSAPI